jgi:hypothetical protein
MKIACRIRDHGDEYSNAAINIPDQAGATVWTAIEVIYDGFIAAVEGLTLGTMVAASVQQVVDENADAAAASPYAQRELGLRFFFHDDTNFTKGYFTVPCPDLANIDLESDGDTADLTDTEVAAMVTWLEANAELNGQSVVVDRAVVVGRAS